MLCNLSKSITTLERSKVRTLEGKVVSSEDASKQSRSKPAKAIEDQQHLNVYPASVQTSSSVFPPEYEDAPLYATPSAVPNPDWTQRSYGPPSSQVAQMTPQRQYAIIFPH
jgi:hypothetical protein